MDTSFKCQIVDQTTDTLTIMCKKAAEPVAKEEERQLGCQSDRDCKSFGLAAGGISKCVSTGTVDSKSGAVINECTLPPKKPAPKKRFTTL